MLFLLSRSIEAMAGESGGIAARVPRRRGGGRRMEKEEGTARWRQAHANEASRTERRPQTLTNFLFLHTHALASQGNFILVRSTRKRLQSPFSRCCSIWSAVFI
jgi:hypothetical protein